MKFWLILVIPVIFFSCDEKENPSIKERFEISHHNFIPINGSEAPNYWCTWGVQNFAGDTNIAKRALTKIDKFLDQANQINEENIFGNKEWASYFPKVAKDLYILFDLGWNTSTKSRFDRDPWLIGSFDLSEDKFPSCTGTPSEKLSKLNELCKKAGWKGAGLRLPAHPSTAAYSPEHQMEEIKKFYYEKMLLCREAGIEYIKIDDGLYSDNLEFRKMVTRVAKEAAPDIIIEHTKALSPINDYDGPEDTIVFYKTGTFKEWGNGLLLEESVNTAGYSDVFHTYDVTSQLSTATTLERVSQILTHFNEPTSTKGVINCSDELYLAAALGCTMGINRHVNFIELPGYNYDPFSTRNRIDEVFRAVRWQRIAQPFGVGRATIYVDSRRLTDSWVFSKGDSWASWLNGDTIIQKAPARISRGMELPEVVAKGEPSYVACSKYLGGAIAIATLPRVSADSGRYYPLVDITIEAEDWDKPIAIFGELKSLTIKFEKLPKNYVVWGQDLASNRAVKITDLVVINENSIKIPGELVKEVGLLAATPGDESSPAMILKVRK